MTFAPSVSVIVPVLDGAAFLGEALESVLAQDYGRGNPQACRPGPRRPGDGGRVEVIVVDDGSEDASAEIARAYADVHVIRQPNRGPAAARNAGIAAASADLVAFLDADDVMLPDRLSRQVEHLRRHAEIGCVFGRQEILLMPGQPWPPWLRDEALDPLDPLAAIRAGGMTATIRREALEKTGGFDERLRHAEDVEWLFRVKESGVGLAVTNDIVGRHRIHSRNLTHQRSAAREGWMMFLRSVAHRRRSAEPAPAEPGPPETA